MALGAVQRRKQGFDLEAKYKYSIGQCLYCLGRYSESLSTAMKLLGFPSSSSSGSQQRVYSEPEEERRVGYTKLMNDSIKCMNEIERERNGGERKSYYVEFSNTFTYKIINNPHKLNKYKCKKAVIIRLRLKILVLFTNYFDELKVNIHAIVFCLQRAVWRSKKEWYNILCTTFNWRGKNGAHTYNTYLYLYFLCSGSG